MISAENTPPSVIDKRAREDGTSIASIRKLIPKECFEIEATRSWGGLVTAFARLAVAELVLARSRNAGRAALARERLRV